MTPEEAAAKMREIFSGTDYNIGAAHLEADELLCQILRELGYGEAVQIFEDADKWYA
jgi:hypothetical protein